MNEETTEKRKKHITIIVITGPQLQLAPVALCRVPLGALHKKSSHGRLLKCKFNSLAYGRP